MSKLEGHLKLKNLETIEIVQQDQQKKEKKLVGSQLRVPGHILWEYDPNTKTLNPANYQTTDYILRPENLRRDSEGNLELLNLDIVSKVEVKKDCIYFQSLNLKNAKKVLKRDYSIEIE